MDNNIYTMPEIEEGSAGTAGYNQQVYFTPPPPASSTSIKSVLSLVFGIGGIVTCCCMGLPGVVFGILGVVMAILSKSDHEGHLDGLAIAGLVVSIIAFILGLSFLCVSLFTII